MTLPEKKRQHDAGPEKRDRTRDTRERLEQLLEENPRMTPKELAEALDISVARIHVLAEKINRKWIVRGRWHKV